MAARERVSVDLDTDVAAILRKHAAEAHTTEGEIVERAVRAYDLRALLRRLQAASELDDDQALAFAREELRAARSARRADA
ncbi:MAG TPA: ribbon-helix-helix protein, CopG family [Solirubrobacteraceae bacterium]|nr:ribbon-helix-helix protein, CopG family [Solirubrobacteraceae bacterium]